MPLADNTAMFLGGSMMSFALPYGAFIVITGSLFFLFRSKHTGPKLRYLTTAAVTSIVTREPGPVPAPPVAAAEAETPEPEATEEAEATGEPDATAGSESEK